MVLQEMYVWLVITGASRGLSVGTISGINGSHMQLQGISKQRSSLTPQMFQQQQHQVAPSQSSSLIQYHAAAGRNSNRDRRRNDNNNGVIMMGSTSVNASGSGRPRLPPPIPPPLHMIINNCLTSNDISTSLDMNVPNVSPRKSSFSFLTSNKFCNWNMTPIGANGMRGGKFGRRSRHHYHQHTNIQSLGLYLISWSPCGGVVLALINVDAINR
jgi:hypothetical protein